MSIPPLLGDEGNYRVYLVGNSGTGKALNTKAQQSTVGAYLSSKLNLPLIALDEVFWKPGWEETPDDEFRKRVSALMAKDPRGWIIDGNYTRLGSMIPQNATDIIWLDPPLWLYFPRLLWRTLLRLLGLRATCAEGCEETWGEVFSTKGIVWFCISNHGSTRSNYAAWHSSMNVQTGGKMRRIDESAGDLTKWKAALEELVRAR
ncbi:hypothetical protein F5I97DRAFT_1830773 [Phlebopus sp. FC_14]|nr:hypothetical protein F5I97DRAFT_1830773 [Phlebopus sp. FC_14]